MEETITQKSSIPSEKVRLSEVSTVGLKVAGGIVYEEVHSELTWPQSKSTYAKMAFDPTIASANQTIKAFIRKTEYEVKTSGKNPTEEQKNQVQFIKECMGDMNESFNDVINEALSMLTYGYCINEKVFKFRNSKGKHKSKYNDGKIGWAKLPIRSQDSIWRWKFDAKGRELKGVEQNLSLVVNHYDIDGKSSGLNSIIELPRSKFLHFRHDVQRNNPEGTSPLRACFIPWSYKSKIEEYQAIGISRDLGGLPVFEIPPEYLSEDAPEDKKAVAEHFKNTIRNLHANEQAGLLLPKYIDPETKQDMFTFRLESTDGGKMYDTDKILNGYENKILMTYLADVLKLGQDASGSFALSDNKTNLLAVGIQSIVEEILQEFNEDLIPQTLLLNGWELSDDMPKISIKDLDERDLTELSKFVQHVVSTGAMEVDEGLSDWLRKQIGAPVVDRSKPIDEKMIGGGQSKSGEGLKTSGEGTAKTLTGGDKSASNSENK